MRTEATINTGGDQVGRANVKAPRDPVSVSDEGPSEQHSMGWHWAGVQPVLGRQILKTLQEYHSHGRLTP